MPRKPSPPPPDAAANIDAELIANDAKAIDQDSHRLAAIDQRYGNNLPYDRRRIIQEARFYLQHSADAMLEAGKCLIMLKEHEPRGDFQTALQDIGIAPRTAQRMMQAAAKFTGSKKALAGLGKTKLIELMVEDDEELEALADGGTLAGFSLDKIDRMTSRELKDALRYEKNQRKQDTDVHEKLLAQKNTKIDELDKELQQLGMTPPSWPRIVDETMFQSATAANQIMEGFDKLNILRDQILTGDLGDRSAEEMEPAIATMAVEYFDIVTQVYGMAGQVMRDCREVFEVYKMDADFRTANASTDDMEPIEGTPLQ